jgi:deferrochelatase/peroxidase EfeB
MEAVMLEGTSAPAGKPSPELGERLAQEYGRKYKDLGYAPEPNSWDEGGLYVFTPRQCIAWSKFNEDPTKFIFEG